MKKVLNGFGGIFMAKKGQRPKQTRKAVLMKGRSYSGLNPVDDPKSSLMVEAEEEVDLNELSSGLSEDDGHVLEELNFDH